MGKIGLSAIYLSRTVPNSDEIFNMQKSNGIFRLLPNNTAALPQI